MERNANPFHKHRLMINYKNTVGDPLQEKFQNFQVFHSLKIDSVGIWCPSVTSFALGACLDMPQNTLGRYLKLLLPPVTNALILVELIH